jgi:hypothetical protein
VITLVKTLFLFSFFIFFGCSKHSLVQGYETSHSNVLYVGVEQPIILKTKYKRLHVSTNVGTVRFKEGNTYIIYTDTLSSKLILTIKKGLKKEEFEFRVKSIPNIDVSVRMDTSSSSSIISANNFHTFTCVIPIIKNFDSNCGLELLSYKMKRISNNELTDSELITKPQTSINTANYIAKKAKQGDIYILENLVVKISTFNDIDKNKKSYHIKLDDKVIYIK